jgi:AraC family transcriptional regulator
MHADIRPLHVSPSAEVLDFRCTHPERETPTMEYQPTFAVSFTRRGAFQYGLGRLTSPIHSGVVLLENAESERIVSHYGALRDECTAIQFNHALFSNGARANQFPTSILPNTPQLEALHSLILAVGRTHYPGATLRIDNLIIEMLRTIWRTLNKSTGTEVARPLDKKECDLHLKNIDRAKDLMRQRFREELSLAEVARTAAISIFHFSRLFKKFTAFSPHQYLIHLRLEHARLLLLNTSLSITEICFESGFNCLEHFIATFVQHHGTSPRKYRRIGINVDRRLPILP